MLEGLTFRFVLALVAVPLVPLGLLYGLHRLEIGFSEKPTSWSLQDVSNDGRTLTIAYGGTSCESPDRVEKSETIRSVRILAVVHSPPFSKDCDDGESFVSEVELERPVWGRELIDAYTGKDPLVADHAAPWMLDEVSDTGRRLTISFAGSSCDDLNDVERRETRRRIEIIVRVRLSLEAGCIKGVRRQIGVLLSRPLDRELLDAHTGRPPLTAGRADGLR